MTILMTLLASLSLPYRLTLKRQKRRIKNKLPFSVRFKPLGKGPHPYLHVNKLPLLCQIHLHIALLMKKREIPRVARELSSGHTLIFKLFFRSESLKSICFSSFNAV